ncbi:helix-turn-helix transcriptional regulator [Rhizobium sp. S163]|uniref:helix-turn-helix domain-containing protein n=1 Tax=Rhizobium sp. S163 TaxID=3055039 RepID=UPI0025A9F3AD|nr:helix-turn-helix transcriptional regulator [Rhizobium sp. S163]MDM9647712.1 helix-turn-helix transcriptional regulator [Rhizobium sp. S163]
MRELRRALDIEDRDELATGLGISKSALAHYERGERTPDGDVLALYRQRYGININWIVTGEGAMFDDPAAAPAPAVAVDTKLLDRLAGIVTSVHRQAGIRIPAEKVAVEAGGLYNDLVNKVDDIRDQDEVAAMLPWIENRLRKRLDEATNEPGTGKRSAS